MVFVGQSEEGGKGVNFKLTFPNSFGCELPPLRQVQSYAEKQSLGHVVQVKVPLRVRILEQLEGVGVGVDHYQLSLHVEES